MKRRSLIRTASVGLVTSTLLAGCTDDDEDETQTYTLRMEEPDGEATDREVLVFDDQGLSRGQENIVQEAALEGSYTEADVAWNTIPGWEPITMEFKMLIQLIARHVDAPPQVQEPTTLTTPSEYDDERYRAVVEVE